MDLALKLQLPPGVPIFLVGAPKGFGQGLTVAKRSGDGAVLVFAANSQRLKEDSRPAIDAAKADRLSWIAYPKAGRLGTDLNRDRLQELVAPLGIQGVRLVSIDDVWSAMRFRPKK